MTTKHKIGSPEWWQEFDEKFPWVKGAEVVDEQEWSDAKVRELAKQGRASFEHGTRSITGYTDPTDLGQLRRPIWVRKDDAPDWVRDLCWESHGAGETLPDDWKYEWIVDALDILEENADEDQARESMVAGTDYAEWDLYTWLRDGKQSYVEEVQEDGLAQITASIFWLVQAGQAMEREEVFNHVYTFIHNLATEMWTEYDEQLLAKEDELAGGDATIGNYIEITPAPAVLEIIRRAIEAPIADDDKS